MGLKRPRRHTRIADLDLDPFRLPIAEKSSHTRIPCAKHGRITATASRWRVAARNLSSPSGDFFEKKIAVAMAFAHSEMADGGYSQPLLPVLAIPASSALIRDRSRELVRNTS
jgi:hypothetical protein